MVVNVVLMDYLVTLLAEVPVLVVLTHYLVIYDFVAVYEFRRVCARDILALIYFSVSHFRPNLSLLRTFLNFLYTMKYSRGV